jgi:hypothetical protein
MKPRRKRTEARKLASPMVKAKSIPPVITPHEKRTTDEQERDKK